MNKFKRVLIITFGGIVGAIIGGSKLFFIASRPYSDITVVEAFFYPFFWGGLSSLSFTLATEFPRQRKDIDRVIITPFYCLGISLLSFCIFYFISQIPRYLNKGPVYEPPFFAQLVEFFGFISLTIIPNTVALALGLSIGNILTKNRAKLIRILGFIFCGAIFNGVIGYFYQGFASNVFLLGGFVGLGVVLGCIISERLVKKETS